MAFVHHGERVAMHFSNDPMEQLVVRQSPNEELRELRNVLFRFPRACQPTAKLFETLGLEVCSPESYDPQPSLLHRLDGLVAIVREHLSGAANDQAHAPRNLSRDGCTKRPGIEFVEHAPEAKDVGSGIGVLGGSHLFWSHV